MHTRSDLQVKREQARATVLSPEELRAIQNLQAVYYAKETAHYDANEARRRQQRPEYLPKEWVQKVIDQGGDKSWGYIFYHYKG